MKSLELFLWWVIDNKIKVDAQNSDMRMDRKKRLIIDGIV